MWTGEEAAAMHRAYEAEKQALVEPSTTHWHGGWNMCGYLPEMEPETLDSWEAAKAFMVDELVHHADNAASWGEDHYCDDIPCPTYGDACPDNQADSLSHEAEDLNLDDGPGWDAYIGNMHYWIMPCEDQICLDSLAESEVY